MTRTSIKNFVNDAPVMLNTPVIQGAELFPAYPSGTGRAEPGCSAQCKLNTIASRNRRPKLMRSAGLLFLGSYDHFDDCYGSVLQTALWPQKANKHQPD